MRETENFPMDPSMTDESPPRSVNARVTAFGEVVHEVT